MAFLAVVASGDTFSAVWTELAGELDLEVHVAADVASVPPAAACLAPIVVVAGAAHDEIEARLRALSDAGYEPIAAGAERDHRVAVRLLNAGATEYFALPGDLGLLRSALAANAEAHARRLDRERLESANRSDFDFRQIIGRSPALRDALDRAARIIPHDRASILITGETGTGKELVARAIHFNGPRALGAFVDINCAAIPGNLLESELFGYERGAFTDARTSKPGLFESADGGTLFLDEIGHMPLDVQGKLLKALEEKRVRRLGSLQSRSVDLRIIAATHVDLLAAVRRGEFREDLYYRLAIIPVHLPPLRERGDDVILLAQHFLRTLADQYGLPAPPIDEALRSVLLRHSWPGNVRELRNAVERALLLGHGRLETGDLFLERAHSRDARRIGPIPFPATMAEIERAAARAMVDHFDGNKSVAATTLGISRSRLYRLLDDDADDGRQPDADAGPTIPVPPG